MSFDPVRKVHRKLRVQSPELYGRDVEELQRSGNDHARHIGLELTAVDGIYGTDTRRLLRSVLYALGCDPKHFDKVGATQGYQKIVRGQRKRNPAQVALAKKRAAAKPLREKAWAEAGKCVGARESWDKNRGPLIDQVIRYAKGDLGEPYCVDGVIWCYGRAGSQVVRPGYTRAVRYMLVPGVARTSSPSRGDIVRFTFDHTGLFGGWRRYALGKLVPCPKALATHFVSREFNTSASGSTTSDPAHDGTDGVYEKVRQRSLAQDFLSVRK